MESDPRRRVLTRRRNPLSDCTNTSHVSSSSSSSVPLKPPPSSSSSSFKKPPTKRISTSNTSTNLHNPSNPSSPQSPLLSTPPPKTSLLQASNPISIVYSRGSASNKRKDKGKAVAIPVSSKPILNISNKRKDKGKAVALPVSKTPILSISNTWEKSDGVEGANVPKAKALTVPCRKKHRSVSSEHDVLKDPLVQDFIEKQKAYFKAIDEFELPEEEVESVDELD